METIWAKSGKMRSLIDHTKDVVVAFETMFGTFESPSRLGECWTRFFRLDDYAVFWNSTLAAALFHDLGKANDGFQRAVNKQGDQLIWHEHLSALMLGLENVHQWVTSRNDIDWDVVLSAVMTHHLRVRSDGSDEFGLAATPSEGSVIEVLSKHEDFQSMLKYIGSRLGLLQASPMIDQLWSFDARLSCVNVSQLRDGITDGRLRSLDKQAGGKKPKDPTRRRLLWAVRSALIAADAVGSAMPRTGKRIDEWVADVMNDSPLCSFDYVWTEILDRRINDLREQGKWKDNQGEVGWNAFQVETGKLPDRALLLAPCGSGKTLAAWRWIAERCHRPVKRIIFLYPTRATATEGFRDYVSWAPEVDATLHHGTSGFDLQGMFENPKDRRQGKTFTVDPVLYALAVWTKRVFSATVDQFLGFMQYSYGPMLMLPLLADSVVVVDEVHSFDRAMFSALKDFLREFDVPVLCMTATLPEVRRTELRVDCGMHVYDEKPGELETIANAPRYKIQTTDESTAFDLVQQRLQEGKRVLWVVNQVKWAQQLMQRFAKSLDAQEIVNENGTPIYCYHSRFRLMDRRSRHQQTVRAFQGRRIPALAITTQVCEMSLDMDADLLVTQCAPITALIQRMGRCNRVPLPRDDAGEIYVYTPTNNDPYSPQDLDGVAHFLAKLSGLPRVSQSALEDALREFGPSRPDIPKASSFLESGAYAMSGDESFRDIEQFTMPAILDSDVEEFLRLQSLRSPTDGFIVPVPNQKKYFLDQEDFPQRIPRYLRIASHTHYHPTLGFCDVAILEGVSQR